MILVLRLMTIINGFEHQDLPWPLSVQLYQEVPAVLSIIKKSALEHRDDSTPSVTHQDIRSVKYGGGPFTGQGVAWSQMDLLWVSAAQLTMLEQLHVINYRINNNIRVNRTKKQ